MSCSGTLDCHLASQELDIPVMCILHVAHVHKELAKQHIFLRCVVITITTAYSFDMCIPLPPPDAGQCVVAPLLSVDSPSLEVLFPVVVPSPAVANPSPLSGGCPCRCCCNMWRIWDYLGCIHWNSLRWLIWNYFWNQCRASVWHNYMRRWCRRCCTSEVGGTPGDASKVGA